MTYIQKDNIYTNIQEMLKCEVHLNNIEKQKSVFGVDGVGGVGGVAKLIVQTSFLRDKDKGVKVGRQKERLQVETIYKDMLYIK